MVNFRNGPSVLLVVILCLSAFGFSDCEYLTEERERLQNYAQNLSLSFNTKFRPCEDFASYVNEGFDLRKLNEFGYNEIKSAYDSFIGAGVVLSRADSKAKDFYESCTEHLPETYLDAITELNIARSVFEFKTLKRFGPTVRGEGNPTLSWSLLVGALQGYDVTAFVSGNAIENEDGSMNIHLAPGKFDLTQTDFWNGDLKSVLQYYGLGEDEIIDLIRSLEEFERKFSDREATSIETNMTIGELQNKFPHFEWKQYFQITANTELITELNQVTVIDLEKVEEYYNAHNFPESTETAVVYYFLKLHAKLNMEYYAVKNDKKMCLIETFNLFKEVFANIVLQNMNEDDFANYNDTVLSILHAASQLASLETRQEIEAQIEETKNELSLAADKEKYKEYVDYNFPFFTDNRYLSNYLRAYNFVRIRRIAGRHQHYLDNIGLYHNLHLKPRLFLLTTIGYITAFGTVQQYNIRVHNNKDDRCLRVFGDAAFYKVLLGAVDYLEEHDPQKFQNEVDALSKYHLTPKKIVHVMFAKIFLSTGGQHAQSADDFMHMFKDFRESYYCGLASDAMVRSVLTITSQDCGFLFME